MPPKPRRVAAAKTGQAGEGETVVNPLTGGPEQTPKPNARGRQARGERKSSPQGQRKRNKIVSEVRNQDNPDDKQTRAEDQKTDTSVNPEGNTDDTSGRDYPPGFSREQTQTCYR